MDVYKRLLSYAGQQYLRYIARTIVCSRNALATKQDENWRRLRRDIQGTRIYRDLALDQVRSYGDYVQKVASRDYLYYQPYIERIEAGEQQVLFPDRCSSFALTSGTSGYDSKRIPLNERTLKFFIRAQALLISRVASLERTSVDLLDFGRLAFGSTPLVYRKNGFDYGYISGIVSTRVPAVFRKKTFPSKRVLAIADWDQKMEALIDESVERDIRFITGIPTYIISVLERILQRTGAENIRAIWPNLRLFLYGGTPINQYVARLDGLVGHELRYYGIYVATEAPIGLPHAKFTGGSQHYILNPELLVTFTRLGTSEALGIHEVRPGEQYLINVGMPNGMVHYSMKDVVRFKELDGELAFEVIGREHEGMNLAAEKVSRDELLKAIAQATGDSGTRIEHFFVSPVLNQRGVPAYKWTLFIDGAASFDTSALAIELDRALRTVSFDYRDCRNVGVIGLPTVRVMDASSLEGYFRKHRDKGQFKPKTTFSSSDEYDSFVRTTFPGSEFVA